MVSSLIGHKFVEVVVPSKLLLDNNLIGYISHALISTGSHNVIIMITNTNVVIVVASPVIHRYKPPHGKFYWQWFQQVPTNTELYRHRKYLGASNCGLRQESDCTSHSAKIKVLLFLACTRVGV